jgi:hypothetical protein
MPVLKYYDAATSSWKVGAVGGASGQVWPTVIGDGVNTSFQVTHGLGTRNVVVTVYRASPPYEEVEVDVERTTESYVTIRTSPTVPAVGEYIAVVASAGTQATANITMDTWHAIGAAGEPAFLAGGNFDAANRPVKFRKYPDGRVRITGVAANPSGTGFTTIFTLPVGYRPNSANKGFSCPDGVTTEQVTIYQNGNVEVANGRSYVFLDSIEFDTESVLQTASLTAQPIEGWHVVGDPGEPQYLNNWGSQDSIRSLAAFRKMPDGTVRLRGVAKSNANQSGQTLMFTLPAGYRPGREEWFTCYGVVGGTPGYTKVEINAAGGINVAGTATNGQNVSLDGISFMAEDVPVGAYASGFLGPPKVTALPANPVDGQECYYVADATNGVIWHLRYNAGSGSAYKWEFVGGGLLTRNQSADGGSVSTGSFVEPPNGPTITFPLAGDYYIEALTSVVRTGAGAGNAQVRPAISSGSLLLPGDARGQGSGFTAPNDVFTLFVNGVGTGIAAAAILRMFFLGGAMTVSFRQLGIRPVRVG